MPAEKKRTRALSYKQALQCETATHDRCRCRCHGAGHGAARQKPGETPDRVFFQELPADDPHHLPEENERQARRRKARGQAQPAQGTETETETETEQPATVPEPATEPEPPPDLIQFDTTPRRNRKTGEVLAEQYRIF